MILASNQPSEVSVIINNTTYTLKPYQVIIITQDEKISMSAGEEVDYLEFSYVDYSDNGFTVNAGIQGTDYKVGLNTTSEILYLQINYVSFN